MSEQERKTLASLLLFPENRAVEAISATEAHVTVQVACTRACSPCPLCQQFSERVHSRYGRTVADVPCGGRKVMLAFTVRKFVCRTPDCPRKIFAERVPDLVQPYARMTNRLGEVLQALGFATCGELGERLTPKLGIRVSASTLLRRMRTFTCPSPQAVRLLGIDDWAWKKGMTYGTILVDLEQHCPIELLPDRSAETVEAWLRTHPEVEAISRDRGGEYAAAARKGAPQAQQIADKFHLVKNLREGLKDFLDGKQSCLPEHVESAADAIPAKARGLKGLPASKSASADEAEEPIAEKAFRAMSPFPRQRPTEVSLQVLHQQIQRENRQARYETVRTLAERGISKREIARRMGLCRETVRKFVEAEIRKLGYPGSQPLLNIFLADLRKKHREVGDPAQLTLDDAGEEVRAPTDLLPIPQPETHRMSPTRASWLFISQPENLEEKQKQLLEQIQAAHPDLEAAYQLTQEFVRMLAERRANDLSSWLKKAEQSPIPELQKFVRGLRRDDAAVKAAFSSEISNGQVEGQVHRLKVQKRQVYGRANFNLLRLRVLHRT